MIPTPFPIFTLAPARDADLPRPCMPSGRLISGV